MPWSAAFPNLAGMLPILTAAKAIVERDFLDALAWRREQDGSTGAVDYARVELMTQHSRKYPLLIIQAATDNPQAPGTGHIDQDSTFDVTIWLTRSIDTSNLADEINELAKEVIRYYDATRMCFLSAPDADWLADFPDDNDSGKVQPWCSAAVFGQLEESVETAGVYAHSVSFELQLRLTEAQ